MRRYIRDTVIGLGLRCTGLTDVHEYPPPPPPPPPLKKKKKKRWLDNNIHCLCSYLMVLYRRSAASTDSFYRNGFNSNTLSTGLIWSVTLCVCVTVCVSLCVCASLCVSWLIVYSVYMFLYSFYSRVVVCWNVFSTTTGSTGSHWSVELSSSNFFSCFFLAFFFVQYQVALNVHSCGSVASVFKMTNILISTPVSEVCN